MATVPFGYNQVQVDGRTLETLADTTKRNFDRIERELAKFTQRQVSIPLTAVEHTEADPPVYGDYLVPGASVGKGSAAPDLAELRDGLYLNAFAGTGVTVEEAFFSVHILHDIEKGSVPTFHVHWTHNQASPSGDVKWQIDYSHARGYLRDAFPEPVSLSTTQTAGAQYAHHITPDDDMPLQISSTIEPDMQLVCRIYRDPADAADTFAADAFLIGVDVHYELGQLATVERNRSFLSRGFL